MATDIEGARDQARAQLDSIMGMVEASRRGGQDNRNTAIVRILEGPLSIEVRSGWHQLEDEDTKASEYMLLLCPGRPTVRITGDLDEYQQPTTVKLQYQDWGTPWELYRTTKEEDDALLTYARYFFGQ